MLANGAGDSQMRIFESENVLTFEKEIHQFEIRSTKSTRLSGST